MSSTVVDVHFLEQCPDMGLVEHEDLSRYKTGNETYDTGEPEKVVVVDGAYFGVGKRAIHQAVRCADKAGFAPQDAQVPQL
jgi:hypothetical protein